jgi:hypothetical protein
MIRIPSMKQEGNASMLRRTRVIKALVTMFLLCASLSSVIALEAAGTDQSSRSQTAVMTLSSTSWSFDLGLYAWLPSVNASVTAGPLRASSNESVTDIWNATNGIPLIGMGRFEARYDRFGFLFDINYFYLDFKNERIANAETGVTSQMGLLDYALTYRVFGEPKGNIPVWTQKTQAPRVDVYAGGRTLWLKSRIEQPSMSESVTETLTAPIVGARAIVDITPRWDFLIDGNLGGFGIDDVKFTGGAMGLLGYRFTLASIPTSFMFGYKLLYYNVDAGALKATTTLHGPVTGLVFSW